MAHDLRPTASFLDGDFDGYRLVFVETPSNPGLDICDIAAVAEAAHAAGATVVADNTTMTPFGQRPLDLGADIVVAADTKAPNGHSDALFGHVASRDPEVIAAVKEWRKLAGGIPGPFEAWLVHRGLETLELRFERMCATAETIAPRLAAHGAVQTVRYPGLESDPAHNLARVQMDRFGFMIGLTLASQAEGRGLHRRMFADPAGHLVRRRPQLGRAARPLGRRGGAGLRAPVGRLRADGGTVERDGGSARRGCRLIRAFVESHPP